MESPEPAPTRTNRRTLLRTTALGTAVWSAPVVIGVAATPAAAVSPPTTARIEFHNTTVDGDGAYLRGNFGIGVVWPALTANVTVTITVTNLAGELAAVPKSFNNPDMTHWDGIQYSFPEITNIGNYVVTFVATGSLTSFEQGGQTISGSWPLTPLTESVPWTKT